jgi:hypothetical protein
MGMSLSLYLYKTVFGNFLSFAFLLSFAYFCANFVGLSRESLLKFASPTAPKALAKAPVLLY